MNELFGHSEPKKVDAKDSSKAAENNFFKDFSSN